MCIRDRRTTLEARENAAVNTFAVFFSAENQAGAWAPQRFVRGCCNKISNFDRIVVQAGRDESGVVRHIDKQFGADIVRDFRKFLVFNFSWVGAGASHNQLRAMFTC